jgi:hypothetical protein
MSTTDNYYIMQTDQNTFSPFLINEQCCGSMAP